MDYDLGHFDLETRVLKPLDNPLGPRLSAMWPVHSVTHVSGLDRERLVDVRGFEPLTPCLQSRCTISVPLPTETYILLFCRMLAYL
jgi:hypothetical protein